METPITMINEMFRNVFLIIWVAIPLILMALALLVGLGWGIKKFLFWVIGDGTTSGFSRKLYGFSPSASAWYDHMTYRPFKGSPRGWQIRMGQKFNIKRWQV